eukprot:460469-Pelagomonas_calceolata.AAC.3
MAWLEIIPIVIIVCHRTSFGLPEIGCFRQDARRWIRGEGESARLWAWPTTRPILISSVSFPLLG